MEDASRSVPNRATRPIAFTLALLAAVQGCSTPFMGTTAASFLRRVRESHDPNIRYAAYSKLASPSCYDGDEQKVQTVEVLVSNLESNREPLATRAVICRTLGELRRPEARQALIKAVGDPEGIVRAEACRALGKVGKPEDATVLSRIMVADTLQDCRIAAIEGLGELKANDERVNSLLVSGMEHDSPAIRLASLQALRNIQGKDLGTDPAAWRDALRKPDSADGLTRPAAPTVATSGSPASNPRR